MGQIAEFTDGDGRNLFHEAAHICLEEGNETRYFMALLRVKFPLYAEDSELRTPAFIINEVRNDDTFLFCLSALM